MVGNCSPSREFRIHENKRVYTLSNNGVLFLDDDINDHLFQEFIRDLAHIHLEGYGNKEKPIRILLNSRGGNIRDGFAIYDAIRGYVKAGAEISIIGLGTVASMAVAIMQSAKTRYALPHTQFGIHQASKFGGESEEVNVARERVTELDRLNRISMGILAERTGMNLEELLDLFKKTDKWYDVDAAKGFGKHGLIDQILPALPF